MILLLHLHEWARGGCLLCGAKERTAGRQIAHDSCWESLPHTARYVVQEAAAAHEEAIIGPAHYALLRQTYAARC